MPLLVDFIDRQFIHNSPPIPTVSYKGQTVIVTGGSSGLGLEACRHLIRLEVSQIIIACRNMEKAKAAIQDIQATSPCSPNTLQAWPLDLSSYASVLAFADRVNTELSRLDVVFANAGIGTRKWAITEGNEESITTNVISMALVGFLLLPKLRESATKYNTKTHLTITGSELYEHAKFKERLAPTGQIFATLNDENNKPDLADRYPTSKLLSQFVARQLAEMSPLNTNGVIVNSVAPGFCQSGLHREVTGNAIARGIIKVLARPTEVGSRTLVFGGTAGPESHGGYLPDEKLTPLKGLMAGEAGKELQERIWLELKAKLEAIRPGVTSLA